MQDTYETAAEAEADCAQHKELLGALGAWDRALRWEECGAWTIIGTTQPSFGRAGHPQTRRARPPRSWSGAEALEKAWLRLWDVPG
jgi:hypothetical protein